MSEQDTNGIKSPNLMGLGTDYAVSNKFILYVPIQNILGKQYSNLELHLTRFNLPQVEMGSTTVSYKSDTVEIPTKMIQPTSKELTIEYIIDSEWLNYRSLYAWAQGIGPGTNITQLATNQERLSNVLPVRIYLLDQYKKKLIQFVYENCWIKRFADLALDYTQQPGEIHHSFTLAYTNFRIEDVQD